MKTLTPAEAGRLYTYLLQSTDPKDVALLLLFETGARVSEALALVGGSLSGECLEISPLKGSLPRRILVSRELEAKLRTQAPLSATAPWGEILFPGAAKASWRRLLCRHYHLLTQRLLGRRRNLHGLRHTAFSRVYAATKDLLLTKAWAGHVAIGSTVVYMEAVAQDRGSEVNLTALKG